MDQVADRPPGRSYRRARLSLWLAAIGAAVIGATVAVEAAIWVWADAQPPTENFRGVGAILVLVMFAVAAAGAVVLFALNAAGVWLAAAGLSSAAPAAARRLGVAGLSVHLGTPLAAGITWLTGLLGSSILLWAMIGLVALLYARAVWLLIRTRHSTLAVRADAILGG
jgi:hypothetical protein